MNQKIPTQRPPQRQPQRPTPKPSAPQTVSPKYGRAFGILMITTVVLLLVSLIVLGVVLCVGGLESASDKPSAEEKDDPSETTKKPTPTPSGIKQKTNITLPCVNTAKPSYSLNNVASISDADGIESHAAVLVDVTNGYAVAAKRGGEKIYPASMTKVMTLLIACENATDPTALLTVTEEMTARYQSFCKAGEAGPSIATGWKAGDQVTVEDALHLVIYKSDTYACWLLAEHIAGSEEVFVQMMNERVSELGLSGSTHFENCTGLYHDNHYTTCIDMATIMAAAMQNATAKKILMAKDPYVFDIYTGGTNTSSVAMYSGWYTARLEKYPYGKALAYYAGNGSSIRLIAGKTGYETIPKYCFVTAGEHEEKGTLYVCVQVGADSPKASTDDTREIYQKFTKK